MKHNELQDKHIVIVGGGVGGLLLAMRLGQVARKYKQFHVTLIDRCFSHVWKPMLHCLAAGTTKNGNVTLPFIPYAHQHGFQYLRASVTGMDVKTKTLHADLGVDTTTSQIKKIPYSAVVFAMGSRANDFNTPGIAQHCLFLDTLDGAHHLNNLIQDKSYAAYLSGKALRIVIIGGGATGVQLAGELQHVIDTIAGYGLSSSQPQISITLLEAMGRILPAMPESLSHSIMAQMRKIGIEVKVNAMVASADAHSLTLKNGEHIESELRIWAAGVKGTKTASALSELDRQRNGQIKVNDNLQSPSDESVFAIGDCSFITQEPVAPTAQAARQQALHLARHLPAWIIKGQPVPSFTYHDRGTVIALSHYNGWGLTPKGKIFGGGTTHGLLPRIIHKTLYRQHYIELLGLAKGFASGCADSFNSYVHPAVELK